MIKHEQQRLRLFLFVEVLDDSAVCSRGFLTSAYLRGHCGDPAPEPRPGVNTFILM